MTLKPSFLMEIPEQTALVARAAFPRGCMYMRGHLKSGVDPRKLEGWREKHTKRI
jgi:hypothetical protein